MPIVPAGPVTVTTPLGPGALAFRSMRGVEELGRPFTYVVDLVSDDANIKLTDLLGQTMTVSLELSSGEPRHFHGHVATADFVETLGHASLYRVVLHPWLWLLSQSANCRIFQHKTTPDIVKQIFSDHGFSDIDDSLIEEYPAAEYVVQYRETDFDFVSRLLERAGIYYYFRHTATSHTLVLCDSISAHHRNPHCDTLPFRTGDDHRTRLVDHVDRWQLRQAITSGKVAVRDFDFERTKVDLTAVRSSPEDHAHADGEVYEYPGGYIQRADGETLARVRLEQRQRSFALANGHTNARALACGALVALSDHPRDDENKEYLVVRTGISLSGHELRSGGSGGGADAEFTCSCDFDVIDSKRPFRTDPITPKPVIEGTQTAIVVGKSGQEIWTDKYGRIKVQFHWDREGKSDENSSCWVRVSQAWAGSGWGSMHLPHAGQEVIVSFLEGDPDRPIVIGRVYDGTNMPWRALPGQQKKNYFRDEGGNYIVMDATKGKERIELYSPYGKTKLALGAPNSPTAGVSLYTLEMMETIVEQDVMTQINGAMTEKIKKDVSTEVEGALTEKIKQDVLKEIEGKLTENTKGDKNENVEGKWYEKVKGPWVEYGFAHKNEFTGGEKVEVFAGAKHESVVGIVTELSHATRKGKNFAEKEEVTVKDHTVKCEETLTILGGGDKSKAVLSAKSVIIHTGDSTVKVLSNGNCEIVAKEKVKLTVGGSHVLLDSDGNFKVNAKHMMARQGKFTTKNVKDLG